MDINRDHILPVSFGKYRRGLPRLRCVCGACNSHFGDTIENAFGRGSVEAVMRFMTGIKPLSELGDLRNDRVTLRWEVPGDYNGMLLTLMPEQDRLRVEPIPQVGFRRASGEGFVYVRAEDMEASSFSPPEGTVPAKGTITVAPNEETRDRILLRLKVRGLPHTTTDSRPWPFEAVREVPVGIRSFLDRAAMRCVAKVCFNYAAHVLGASAVLHPDFSACRSFIRYDEGEPRQIIQPESAPIFVGETEQWKVTNGHVLTLEWQGGRHIVGRFSPFNMVKYRVVLAPFFGGIWRQIRSGHVFDWERRYVHPMIGTSRSLWHF